VDGLQGPRDGPVEDPYKGFYIIAETGSENNIFIESINYILFFHLIHLIAMKTIE
jgi:hypothetical protein